MGHNDECVGLKGCGYWYADEPGEPNYCHYPASEPEGWAPCEQDD